MNIQIVKTITQKHFQLNFQVGIVKMLCINLCCKHVQILVVNDTFIRKTIDFIASFSSIIKREEVIYVKF